MRMVWSFFWKKTLADGCTGHIGLCSLLLCRTLRLQFQVESSVRKEEVNEGMGVMGQRKEKVRRIKVKGCRDSTVTTQ